jgi:hypothetical protein
MKYLYLLIRHMFPRHKWEVIQSAKEISGRTNEHVATVYTLQDQFGNIKSKRVGV